MQEVFVILNGTVAMTVDGNVVELQGGDAILQLTRAKFTR